MVKNLSAVQEWKLLGCVWLFAAPWTMQPMAFSRPGYWSWVAIPFFRQPRVWTQVSHNVGRFFTSWATRGAQECWSGQPMPSPGDLLDSGIKPGSPALPADSLPAELPGEPKNTGVGSLSLLQGIFLTQESNWGLLHCTWILYQLSYQGNPQGRRAGFSSWVRKIPWRREWQPTPVFFLVNPMDRGAWQATVHGVTGSGMTEWLTLRLNHYFILPMEELLFLFNLVLNVWS